jgi:serine/threonine protein kinase
MSVPERLSAALSDRYEIERELGEGGMATVYLAADLKHNRNVALKVLKSDVARMLGTERFLSEIETTARLQHPNILPLFDSGEADGFLFYAMPYVEGETLRDKLQREVQLPVDQALDLIRKVAAALDYAHQRGIVHRDIKPANILLSSGEPLVADFGIALAVQQAGEGRMTQTGLSMGTPHYMSPEQASGDRSLDPRSDVYALGCVLYEMLAGDPPFAGSSAQAILARILTTAPDRVTVQRPTVPPHVDATIAKSLEKIPADRFTTAGDFRKALDDPGFRHTTQTRIESLDGPPVIVRTRNSPLVAVLGAALILVVVALGFVIARPSPETFSQKYVIDLPGISGRGSSSLALSRDGRRVAYLTEVETLEIRSTSEFGARVVESDDIVRGIFFSPDGESLGFIRGTGSTDGVSVVRVDGGTPVQIASPPGGIQPYAAWSEDGYVYMTPERPRAETPLFRVSEGGGAVEEVMPSLAGTTPSHLAPIPGYPGRLLAVLRREQSGSPLAVLDVEADRIVEIPASVEGVAPEFARGTLFWVATTGDLLAQPFDPEAVEFTGPPVTLAQGVVPGDFALSEAGTLIYRSTDAGLGSRSGGETLGWVDRSGNATALDDRLASNFDDFDDVRLSVGGDFLAAEVSDQPGNETEQRILIYEFEARSWFYLTLPGQLNVDPRWLDDGRVVYRHFDAEGGVRSIRAQRYDRTGSESVLFETDVRLSSFAVTADGRFLAVALDAGAESSGTEQGIHLVDVETGTVTPFLVAPYYHYSPEISPDGRWITYVSYESGTPEVFVQAFPGRSRPYPISAGRGVAPRWSFDGSEIVYEDAQGQVTVAQLDIADGVRVVERTALFAGAPRFEFFTGNAGATFDMGPDGRFIGPLEAGALAEPSPFAVLITDVFAELEARRREGR